MVKRDEKKVAAPLKRGKKQQHSAKTRTLLLKAAEKLFARDGFEAAKLEDIAAEAGFTRGAFYANFDSKEDLFLSMLEERIQERIQAMRLAAEQCTDSAAKLAAIRDQFLNSAKDPEWPIIGLEFKLFALRHPEMKAKLAALRKRILSAATRVLETQMKQSGVQLPVSSKTFVICLIALSQGMNLDRILDRSLSEEEMDKAGRIFFECMVQKRA